MKDYDAVTVEDKNTLRAQAAKLATLARWRVIFLLASAGTALLTAVGLLIDLLTVAQARRLDSFALRPRDS
jgi:hypothetical protein